MDEDTDMEALMAALESGGDITDLTDSTSASMQADDVMGIEGLSFSVDSETGMLDTVIIITLAVLASLYALTRIAEKAVKIRKDYLDSK